MPTVFDYLDWRGDITFSETDINEVDSLILSVISYVDFDSIVPSEHTSEGITLMSTARKYLRARKGEPAYIGAIVPPATLTLLAKAAKTKRFANIRLKGYINNVDRESQKQISALTYVLGNGSLFVAYRGTDDSLIGWKENFNMSFMSPVPSQTEAVEYLNAAAEATDGRIYLGGHSKGGNLAVFATVKCAPEVKERIVTAYNNDGPGFNTDFIAGTDYQNIKGKIRTLVPQSSIVGMLLEHEETYEVIKSSQNGILQHDPFSWELLGSKFIYLDEISDESRNINQTMKNWLNDMDMSQREEFVDAIYNTLSSTNATTLTDISADKIKLLRAWNNLSEENKNIIMRSIKTIFKESFKLSKSKKKSTT